MIDPENEDVQGVVDALTQDPPRASSALKRRVRHTIILAAHLQRLRVQAAVLTASGAALLAVAVIAAFSVPR